MIEAVSAIIILIVCVTVVLVAWTAGMSGGWLVGFVLLTATAGVGAWMIFFSLHISRQKKAAQAREDVAAREVRARFPLDDLFVNVEEDRFLGTDPARRVIVTGSISGPTEEYGFETLQDVYVETTRTGDLEQERQDTPEGAMQAMTSTLLASGLEDVLSGGDSRARPDMSRSPLDAVASVAVLIRLAQSDPAELRIPFFHEKKTVLYPGIVDQRSNRAEHFRSLLRKIIVEQKRSTEKRQRR